MRVLVCGDREWKNKVAIWRELARFPHPQSIVLIHGDCRGADRLGRDVARELGMGAIAFPAEWPRYGKGAGPIRNQQMLDEGEPNLVLAFHSDIARSKGPADMIARAKKAGIPVRLIEN